MSSYQEMASKQAVLMCDAQERKNIVPNGHADSLQPHTSLPILTLSVLPSSAVEYVVHGPSSLINLLI
jgi:hypothetical protein